LRHDFNRLGVALRISITENVDRIAVAPVRGKKFVQLLQGRFGKLGEFSAVCDKRVGG